MEESSWIDKVLTDARQGVVVRIRANSKEYEAAIDKAIAYNLITDNTHRLTEKGYKAIEVGGYEKWKKLSEKGEVERPLMHVGGNAFIGGSAFIGSNNSDNKVSQPEDNSARKLGQTNTHEVKMSTAQFIVWLLTFFASGIGIGYMIFNILKK